MLVQASSDGSDANYLLWLIVLFLLCYSLLPHHSTYGYGMQLGVSHVLHLAPPMHHLSLLVTRLYTRSAHSAHQHSQLKQGKGQK